MELFVNIEGVDFEKRWRIGSSVAPTIMEQEGDFVDVIWMRVVDETKVEGKRGMALKFIQQRF